MSEEAHQTTHEEPENIPVVRSAGYRFEPADRVTLAKMTENHPNVPAKTVFTLSFFRMQVVPAGLSDDLSFRMEEAVLGTFLIDEEQAKTLLESLENRLRPNSAVQQK